LGAVLSLSSVKKAFEIKIEEEKCVECLKCETNCSMNVIDVKGQMGLRWGSECISCLECRDVCPADAIRFGA
jgi:NAD-dependent dihydropyrimidine dehydrogenase PreA subunit